MIITFRQGIISAKTDQLFINFAGNKININANGKSTDLAFAYGASDYLFSEIEDVTGAWGPFSSGTNYWIYWDIDLRSGLRTFGSTTLQPLSGASTPISSGVDQHFFDLAEKKMKVWDGSKWNEKLRVFAGKVQGGTTIVPEAFGSQVGLSGNYSLGYILFDINGKPITRSDSGSTYFVTTEDKVHTQYDNKNAYKIDSLLIDGVAVEPIPAYHCLSWKGARQLGVTSYVTYTYPCVGISIEPSGKNEVNRFITKGFLNNFNNWNWTQPANTPLFVGALGEITTEVPQRYSLQKIGHIVSPDTIFIDIQEQILIEDAEIVVSITPSPTPTATLTPSVSVSRTPAASSTPQPTHTTTPSVSATVSLSPTPTPSVEASSTSAVTPTPSASLTPVASPTPTPSVSVSVPAVQESDYIVYSYTNDNSNGQVLDVATYDGTNVNHLTEGYNTGHSSFINNYTWKNANNIQGISGTNKITYGNGYGYRTAIIATDGSAVDGAYMNANINEKWYLKGTGDLSAFSFILGSSYNFAVTYQETVATVTYTGTFQGTLYGNVFGDGFTYDINNGAVQTVEDKIVLFATGYPNNPVQNDKLIYLTVTYTGNDVNGKPQVTVASTVENLDTILYSQDSTTGLQGLYDSKSYTSGADTIEVTTLGPGPAIIRRDINSNQVTITSPADINNVIQSDNGSSGYSIYLTTLDTVAFVLYDLQGEGSYYYLYAIDMPTMSIISSVLLGTPENDFPSTNLPKARLRVSTLNNETVIYTFTGYNIYKFINNQFVDAGVSELLINEQNYQHFIDTWVGNLNFITS